MQGLKKNQGWKTKNTKLQKLNTYLSLFKKITNFTLSKLSWCDSIKIRGKICHKVKKLRIIAKK